MSGLLTPAGLQVPNVESPLLNGIPQGWQYGTVRDISLLTPAPFFDFAGIPAYANEVKLLLSNLGLSSSGIPQLQIGGDTAEVGGYSGAVSWAGSSGGGLANSAAFNLNGANGAANRYTLSATFQRISANDWLFSFDGSYNSQNFSTQGSGNKTLTTPLKMIRLLAASGNVVSGVCNHMWRA